MRNNYINYNNIHHIAQILGDCGGIYTLLNQMPQSQMIGNNVMVNCPTDVHQHANGSHNTIADNGTNTTNASQTMASAGIEAAYADIKTMKAPLPSFCGVSRP